MEEKSKSEYSIKRRTVSDTEINMNRVVACVKDFVD